jgi:ribosomal protein S19E (S16A)
VLVLTAAAQVDHLGFPSSGTSIENGVFRSLVIKGYLAHHKHGYQITDYGRAIVGNLPSMKEAAE